MTINNNIQRKKSFLYQAGTKIQYAKRSQFVASGHYSLSANFNI